LRFTPDRLIMAAGGRAMSEELFAVSKVAPTPAAQADYDAICAALMHTARGRWFLEEYAKRNRSADTRLLLTAIERIEAVVCAERNKQAQQGLRTDLLAMAKAITRTRAEVAEIRAEPAPSPASAAGPHEAASPRPRPPQPRDVFAAAERIRDVTWAMRGHGFDPSTCDQLEELAAAILSASSLRDPSDHRASKLSEVLQYLEHRIDALLETCTDGDAEPMSGPDRREALPANGFASPFVTAPVTKPVTETCELEAADFEADPASPPWRPIDFGGAPPAARIEVEEIEVVDIEVDAVELDVIAVEAADLEGESQPASPISAQIHELGARAADHMRAVPEAMEGEEPSPAAPAPVAADAASPDEPGATPAGAWEATDGAAVTGAVAKPQDAPLPALEPIDSSQLLPRSPALRAPSAAARSFLPEIDMPASLPGLEAAWARRLPPAAAAPPQAPAATAEPPCPPPPAQPAAAATMQAPQADPLAGLKAMSENELIALFS
jgi:hypothetical protein